jgi:glycosyltransferase involved in cell wall biosynthesis
MTPDVSILIANYNYEAYVGEAIASALAQTHPSVEVIVVDDGSKDGSRAVIEGFSGITAVFQENAGHVAAARRGLDLAKGRIVIFLDADDALSPQTCARVVDLWRDDLDALQFRLEVVGAGTPPGATLPAYRFEQGSTRAHVLATGSLTYPPTSGNAYRRDFARAVFERSQGLTHSGFDMWLAFTAALTEKVISVDEVLGRYRVHLTNMSQPGRSRTLSSIKCDLYYAWNAQQSAFRVAKSLGVAIEPPPHLIGPYYLTWYLLLRDAPPTRWDIPPVPRLAGLVTGLGNFARLPTIGVLHRIAGMAALTVIAFAPKPLRRFIAHRWYGHVDDLGF